MSSWRDAASQQTQDDLDSLLSASLEFAKKELGKHGEFYPYAAAIAANGELELIGVLDGEDHPASPDVITSCIEILVASRSRIRAAAITSDVRTPEGDAIRVELEHAGGPALSVLLPYTKKRLKRSVDYGAMRAGTAQARVWAPE